MKKVQKFFAVLLIFSLGFGAGWIFFMCNQSKDAEVVDSADADGVDLRLPGETEKCIVAFSEVETQLKKAEQLVAYSSKYSFSRTDKNKREVFGYYVWGTTNTIHLEGVGVVKVGFDMDDIVPAIDNESQEICISLPEPMVQDNYVIWDSIKSNDKNCMANPIEFEQYQQLIGKIEQEGLAQAEEEGIYEAARENAKNVIQAFLSGFDSYEVVFL